MKRLICVMACLPMAACVANSTPVGDLNGGTPGDAGAEGLLGTGTTDADPGGSGVGEGGSGMDQGGGRITDEGGSGTTDEGGSTDGGELSEDALDPAECLAQENAGQGAAGLDLGDWPNIDPLEDSGDFAGTCTIALVDVSGGTVTTTLECMTAESGPHTVTIGVGEPSVGGLTWDVGDSVDLAGNIDSGGGGHVAVRAGFDLVGGAPLGGGVGVGKPYGVAMRRPQDGALLLAASRTLGPGSELLAPLQVQVSAACLDDAGCGAEITEGRWQSQIAEPGGESVVVTGGRHAELPLADGSLMVFDVPRYHVTDADCHYLSVSMAARRVNP